VALINRRRFVQQTAFAVRPQDPGLAGFGFWAVDGLTGSNPPWLDEGTKTCHLRICWSS